MTTQLSAIKSFIEQADSIDSVRNAHTVLANSHAYIRDDNQTEHFCVYFAGVDVHTQKVFMGYHKKAEQWLFNGGHLDSDESLSEAVLREAQEEWGIQLDKSKILPFTRLSVTPISNVQLHHVCTTHFDLWHFISLDSKTFKPDDSLMQTEFYQYGWLTISEAKKLVINDNTHDSLDYIVNCIMNC